MIVINLFMPLLSFMLQLAAAAPGLFMPLLILLLKIINLKMIVIIRLSPRSCDLTNLLVGIDHWWWGTRLVVFIVVLITFSVEGNLRSGVNQNTIIPNC